MIPNASSLGKEDVELNKNVFIVEYHKLVQIIWDNELNKRKVVKFSKILNIIFLINLERKISMGWIN